MNSEIVFRLQGAIDSEAALAQQKQLVQLLANPPKHPVTPFEVGRPRGRSVRRKQEATHCAAGLFVTGGEVVVHRLAGPLQVVALDEVDPGLPEGGQHAGALDEGHDGQLGLGV